MNPAPTIGHCWRFIGSGPAYGILQRIVLNDGKEIVSVQECSGPRFSWLGTVEDFLKEFVFVMGPAPSWNRGTNV